MMTLTSYESLRFTWIEHLLLLELKVEVQFDLDADSKISGCLLPYSRCRRPNRNEHRISKSWSLESGIPLIQGKVEYCLQIKIPGCQIAVHYVNFIPPLVRLAVKVMLSIWLNSHGSSTNRMMNHWSYDVWSVLGPLLINIVVLTSIYGESFFDDNVQIVTVLVQNFRSLSDNYEVVLSTDERCPMLTSVM